MGRDTNFYYSFLVLPAAQRRAIVSVWDFCRAVDDTVDEPSLSEANEIARRVGAWRCEVSRIFGAGQPDTPQGRALQPVCAEFGLSRQPFDDLIDGVAMDVGDRRYETFADLREYCVRVASTIGLMCIEIFGARDARAYAIDLGIALQLTNILRDVRVDLSRGRLYIPLDELERFGCTEQDLRNSPGSEPVRRLLHHQATRARDYFARARAARPAGAARRLVAAEIMAAIYRAILERIEARDYDVFSALVRVPRPRRAVIALSTWMRVLAGMA
ncbi:MAG: phytoene/squalene synthase family protein [Vicinamibacterales bacterium]